MPAGEDTKLICRCGVEVGRLFYDGDVCIGAEVGALVVHEFHGRCKGCGRPIHFTVGTRAWLALMSRYGEVPFSLDVGDDIMQETNTGFAVDVPPSLHGR